MKNKNFKIKYIIFTLKGFLSQIEYIILWNV